jgi:hemoglobin
MPQVWLGRRLRGGARWAGRSPGEAPNPVDCPDRRDRSGIDRRLRALSGKASLDPGNPPPYHRGMPSLYDFAGGEEALHRLEGTFYTSVLKDPLLQPLFGAGQPQHVDHLTAFTAESFGGPDRFTRELGFAHLINVHRHLRITEEQRQRFVELYMAAVDAADMPDDEDFREAVRSHVEFGSNVAMQNSLAETDEDLHPLREVPRWTWARDD